MPFTNTPTTMNPSTKNPMTQKPSTKTPTTMTPSTKTPMTKTPSTKTPTTMNPSTLTMKPITAQPTLPVAQLKCLRAASGFNLFNFSMYDEWMTNSTRLELAEVGLWEGPKEIEEYLCFTAAPAIIKHYVSSYNASKDFILVRKSTNDTNSFLILYQLPTWIIF